MGRIKDLRKPKDKEMAYRKKVKTPLTSEETLKTVSEDIIKRNKTNRDRSKAMERKVAKYLGGRRQPGSGAMSPFKGDCLIPLQNHKSSYLIECKSSASMKGKYHRIRLALSWFPKLEFERKAMNCLFGILIIHFHNQVNDYVFFALRDVQRLKKWFSEDTLTFFATISDLPLAFDMTVRTDGTERKGFELLKHQLDAAMLPINNIRVAKVRSIDGDYFVFRLEDFRDIIAEL